MSVKSPCSMHVLLKLGGVVKIRLYFGYKIDNLRLRDNQNKLIVQYSVTLISIMIQ